MSEISQYEAAMLFQSSWLLEQIVRTELELCEYYKKPLGDEIRCHEGNFDIGDKTYRAEVRLKERKV